VTYSTEFGIPRQLLIVLAVGDVGIISEIPVVAGCAGAAARADPAMIIVPIAIAAAFDFIEVAIALLL
jgi:hypothetical protein